MGEAFTRHSPRPLVCFRRADGRITWTHCAAGMMICVCEVGCGCEKDALSAVIASEATQSGNPAHDSGLLRFARNDEEGSAQ